MMVTIARRVNPAGCGIPIDARSWLRATFFPLRRCSLQQVDGKFLRWRDSYGIALIPHCSVA